MGQKGKRERLKGGEALPFVPSHLLFLPRYARISNKLRAFVLKHPISPTFVQFVPIYSSICELKKAKGTNGRLRRYNQKVYGREGDTSSTKRTDGRHLQPRRPCYWTRCLTASCDALESEVVRSRSHRQWICSLRSWSPVPLQ